MDIELPDTGTRLKPGKIVCVGRNYAGHTAEMKSEIPREPLLFLKPSTALVGNGGTVVLPSMSSDVHHEVEVVLVIGRTARHVSYDSALSHVAGYALGLDMTARDLQAKAKQGGQPWSVAKGFDTFAPLGPVAAATTVANISDVAFELRLNGRLVQKGHTGDMIFSPAQLLAYASQVFTLEPGDLVYTGTPEGVGPVHAGDVLSASGQGLPGLEVKVRDSV